jgi:hypothetical protein
MLQVTCNNRFQQLRIGRTYADPVSMDAAPGPPAGRDVISEVLAAVRERRGRATPARRLLLEALTTAPGHHSGTATWSGSWPSTGS